MKKHHVYLVAFALLFNVFRHTTPTISWGLDFQIYWNALMNDFNPVVRGMYTPLG